MAEAELQVDVQFAADVSEAPSGLDWRGWARAAVKSVTDADARQGGLTIRLVGREESARLNEQFRGASGPTNVLAFAHEAVSPLPDSELGWGDLVICLPVAAHEAAAQAKSLSAHLAHLTVHGTLHLLGHDHEDDNSARNMENLETSVLAGLGYSDPYAVDESE